MIFTAYLHLLRLRDSAEEMERYFREFEENYPFRRLPRRLRGRFALQQSMFGISLTELIDGANLARSFESLESDECLMVRRCTYASPGITVRSPFGWVEKRKPNQCLFVP